MIDIAKGAHDPQTARLVRSFHGSAREGFAQILSNVLTPENDRVLLPAFIGWSPREGSGVFDPVCQSNATPSFYTLRDDLTVDLALLEQALQQHRPKVLLLIHYFGRAEPALMQVAELAQRYSAVLIEDLAHGLYTALRGGAGFAGAASLYSLHKMLPVKDGGFVQYLEPMLVPPGRSSRPELADFLAQYDLPAIALRRRANYVAIAECLTELPECGTLFELLWPDLSVSEVPQTFPVRIRNGRRDAIYAEMNAQGIGMTSLYHTLIDAVADGFGSMHALASEITNFPVHQDMMPDQARPMVESFRRALIG